MVPPVFKTGLAAIAVAGGFDSLPPPPQFAATQLNFSECQLSADRTSSRQARWPALNRETWLIEPLGDPDVHSHGHRISRSQG